jgi:hypothetical protein
MPKLVGFSRFVALLEEQISDKISRCIMLDKLSIISVGGAINPGVHVGGAVNAGAAVVRGIPGPDFGTWRSPSNHRSQTGSTKPRR